MRGLLPEVRADTSVGAFRFNQRHRHDVCILAAICHRPMYPAGCAGESDQVIRSVLPRETHQPKTHLATIYGHCRSSGAIQGEEARFDSFHRCTCNPSTF